MTLSREDHIKRVKLLIDEARQCSKNIEGPDTVRVYREALEQIFFWFKTEDHMVIGWRAGELAAKILGISYNRDEKS